MRDALGRFKKGNKPECGFEKGRKPWNKGTKGIMKPNKTSFKKGSTGDKCGHWKGGVRTHTRGYIQIYIIDHPYSCVRNTVFEHRLMVEDYIGRYLTPEEVVHHINGIKDDNRPENLEVTTREKHDNWTLLKIAQERIRELESITKSL